MEIAYLAIPAPRHQTLLVLPILQLPLHLGNVLARFFLLMLVTTPASGADDQDPFVTLNRGVHNFNRTLDSVLLKPMARTYNNLMPAFAKKRVKNIFGNLDDINVTLNDLLQLKFRQATRDFSRFAINSTFGIAGLFNVASSALNMDKHHEDFGQTLAYWKVRPGPYLVLPFFGPSTVRDSLGLLVDTAVAPTPNISHMQTRNAALLMESVDSRSSVLDLDNLVIGDSYLFFRGSYLQHRHYEVQDGFLEVAFEEF